MGGSSSPPIPGAGTVTRLTDAQSFVTTWDTDGAVHRLFHRRLGGYRVEVYQQGDSDDVHYFADVAPHDMYWTAIIGLKRLGAAAGYPEEDRRGELPAGFPSPADTSPSSWSRPSTYPAMATTCRRSPVWGSFAVRLRDRCPPLSH